MRLTALDWTIILAYLAASLFIGLYFTRRASSSVSEFFLSGRTLPWWLAGTSMIATTFSSDTPLYVTGLVREHGIYENWQWWCFMFSGMLSVFFFARLWRKLGVLTDVELIALRYAGRPASFLRGFKALYFSLAIHTIIKAQVILAMAKILDVSLGWGKWESILISSAVTVAYSMLSGYWGVVTTDFFQFIIAMAGALVLAVAAVAKAGGITAMKAQLGPETLSFFPPVDGEFVGTAFMAFLGYVGLSWWSKYSSDGGGVIVQRMASCKDEKQSLLATFYFNIANYGLRTWPWILAALASLVLYPAAPDHEAVYPQMMVDLLPAGLRGLMLASFFAAFMSTLSTYLNLSSAYFVNDFYRPFLRQGAPESHYIAASRAATLALSVVTAVVTYYTTSIIGVFKFLIAFGSGTGLVYILRWFWWRINAWSEISAMVASTFFTVVAYNHPALSVQPYSLKLLFIITASTAVWLAFTFATPPVAESHLAAFHSLTRPGGPGWRPIARLAGSRKTNGGLGEAVRLWAGGSVMVAGLTIGIGKMLLGYFFSGSLWLVAALLSGWRVWLDLRRIDWKAFD